MTGHCCVLKYLSRSVDKKHLTCTQRENPVYKFFQPSVELGSISAALSCRSFGEGKRAPFPNSVEAVFATH